MALLQKQRPSHRAPPPALHRPSPRARLCCHAAMATLLLPEQSWALLVLDEAAPAALVPPALSLFYSISGFELGSEECDDNEDDRHCSLSLQTASTVRLRAPEVFRSQFSSSLIITEFVILVFYIRVLVSCLGGRCVLCMSFEIQSVFLSCVCIF